MNFSHNPLINELFRKVSMKNHRFHLIHANKTIGHSLAIGNPGKGKTSGNRREVELRVDANQKVFCLYDAGRLDMGYFLFPSQSPFWRKPRQEGKHLVGAKAYKTELLYPVTKNLPTKLPNLGVPFTIPVSSLDDADIAAMVGFENQEKINGMLGYMQNYVTEDTTPTDFIHIMAAALKKVGDTDGIKPSHHSAQRLKYDVFQPLLNEGILSSGKAKTALKIEDHIKDRHTISVLVLRHCPQKLYGFLVHYLMNHIYKALTGLGGEKRVKVPTTIVLNEVKDLLIEDSEEQGQSGMAISKLIARIAKQSRSAHLFMLLDTQLPQELPAIRNIIERIYVYNSSPAATQKAMEIMGYSTRTGILTSDDLSLIPFLPRGWYYLFDKQGVSLHKQVWTRSRTFLDGEDFYDIYDKVYGRTAYQDISHLLAELKNEREESKGAWELKKKLEQPPEEEEEEEELPVEIEDDPEYEDLDEEDVQEEKQDTKPEATRESRPQPVEIHAPDAEPPQEPQSTPLPMPLSPKKPTRIDWKQVKHFIKTL